MRETNIDIIDNCLTLYQLVTHLALDLIASQQLPVCFSNYILFCYIRSNPMITQEALGNHTEPPKFSSVL